MPKPTKKSSKRLAAMWLAGSLNVLAAMLSPAFLWQEVSGIAYPNITQDSISPQRAGQANRGNDPSGSDAGSDRHSAFMKQEKQADGNT